ncbi:chitinase [Vibrio sp. JCM 19236]|nr:chitinase [Vibrio sp. JCM 19236]
MNKFKLGFIGVSLAALFSHAVTAAPTAVPAVDVYGSSSLKFSKIQLEMESTSGYNQMVSYQDQVDINILFNQWSGETGDTYKIYFDGIEVANGPITGSQTTANFTYSKGGRYQMSIAACDSTGCVESPTNELIIADTDGSHLEPLVLNVDPNNKTYNTSQDTVVGTYFVEWGIYGRDFTVDEIPADNLTHILYGFIPICGANQSLKDADSGSHRALQTACSGVPDYEVVVHDPWAAFQKSFSQAGHEYSDPVKGNYAMFMALKQRNPDLKIIPSIGGWTLSDPFYGFTDKANRDVFVASVKRFLNTWKFYDGVDIDWEYPGGGGANAALGNPQQDGQAYVDLMRELRAMLDELEIENGRTYELTSAIGVGYDKIEDVDYGQAVQYMDYIFMMSYDFYGGWSNTPGHHTALYCGAHLSADECNGTGNDSDGNPRLGPAYTTAKGVDLLLSQGVPASKLVVGAAKYGRGWSGVTPDTLTIANNPMSGTASGKLTGTTAQGIWEAGVIDYKGIKVNMLGASGLGINGFEYGYDDQAEAPWVWNKTTGELITYDDARSIQAKGAYVQSLGLAGLFSWVIDADNGDILNAMHESLASGNEPVNRAPIADAGLSQSVEATQIVTLSGESSTDSDGSIVSYSWIQTSGSSVTLSNPTNVTTQFTAPDVTQSEVLGFTLTVTDDQGESNSDSVSITVNPIDVAPENTAPIANIRLQPPLARATQL